MSMRRFVGLCACCAVLAGMVSAADLPDPKTGGKTGAPVSILFLRGHCEMDFGNNQPTLDETYQKKLTERGYRTAIASEWQELTADYLKQFNLVCYLNPGPYLSINRYLDATQWRGGIHLLTVQKNAKTLEAYVRDGGGLFIFPALEEAGMSYMSSLEDLLAPYGISTEAACVRDPAHMFEAAKVGFVGADYSWTENIAKHPTTAGAKRVYYPSYCTRWDDNYTTIPLFPKDAAWTALVGSMPGTPCMINKGSIYDPKMPWITWPGKENPAILAARDFGKGRVAVCGISPFFLFYYTYMKNVNFSEANYSRVDGIAMENGDGTTKSDLIGILDGTYRWMAQASTGADMGGYVEGKGATLAPADLSKDCSYYLSDRPTTDDPRVSGPVRPMKILVGAHSAFGGGEGTPAEWAEAAKVAGYDAVCFTEHLDKLDATKWADYVADCQKASDDQVALVPGLDAMSTIDARFLILGHYWNLRPHILSPDRKRIDWTGHMLLGMESVNAVVARPQWHATVREKGAYLPGNYKHTTSVAIATYDASGKQVDDGRFAYKWQLDNASMPYPVAVHELYAPSEVAMAAKTGMQNYYPYDTPARAAEAFCAGHGNFGGNAAKLVASSGPQGSLTIDDWMKPEWTATLNVSSDAPITEVLVSDQRGVYRRFAPNAKEATISWSGNLAVQHWFLVEATDANGGKAVFSPLRNLPKTAVVRCMDRQNYFTGLRGAMHGSLYPGMHFGPMRPATIELPGVTLKEKVITTFEFAYAGPGYHILDVVLGSTMVPGGIAPSADNSQSYNELPIPEYTATLRIITHTRLADKSPVLRQYRPRVTLKQDLTPKGDVWPVFATVQASKEGIAYASYDAKANKTVAAVVAKDGCADLPAGSTVGDILTLVPMRVNAKGQLGLAAPSGAVKAGTVITADFATLPDKIADVRASAGLTDATPYRLALTQGKAQPAALAFVADAKDGGIAGTVATTGQGPLTFGLLPLAVANVNPRASIGLWRPESGISAFAAFEGIAIGQIDPTKPGAFYFGNLLLATSADVDMAFAEPWTKDRAVFEVCNPTAKAITVTITSPKAIADRLAISAKVDVAAGDAVLVSIDASGTTIKPMKERTTMPMIPLAIFNRKHILFYGDSLTDGSSYPDYVLQSLNAAYPKGGYSIGNSAKCGDTTRDLLARFEADIVAKRPDVVSICIGANDAARKVPVEEYGKNLDELVGRVRVLGAQPILFLTSHRAQADEDAMLQLYLAAVRDVARKNGLPLIDANTLFKTWDKTGKKVLAPDGLHHGPDGFPAMARAFLHGLGLQSVPLVEKVTPWPGALTA